jgi:hypothetical protein
VSPRDELRERLAAFPRVRLAALPTPLERCERLSRALGGPEIWIKRDDLTGLALGGNKTRQLEFVFADILRQGHDTVVAGAYSQSNWCRQMTAAARKLGLEVALVLLHGEKGPLLQGNLRLMGADVTVVDLDTLERIQPLLDAKAGSRRAPHQLLRQVQLRRARRDVLRHDHVRHEPRRRRGRPGHGPVRRGGHPLLALRRQEPRHDPTGLP